MDCCWYLLLYIWNVQFLFDGHSFEKLFWLRIFGLQLSLEDRYGFDCLPPELVGDKAAWLTAWIAAWITAWLTAWLTAWIAAWITAWLTAWLTAWIAAWLTAWLTAWITAWLTAWLTAGITTWLVIVFFVADRLTVQP